MARFYFLIAVSVMVSCNLLSQEVTSQNKDTLSAIKRDTVPSVITNIKPLLTISKSPNSAIVVDGKLEDAGWKNACEAKDFVEIYPGDNCKAPVATEVLMTYDDNNLYM